MKWYRTKDVARMTGKSEYLVREAGKKLETFNHGKYQLSKTHKGNRIYSPMAAAIIAAGFVTLLFLIIFL